MGMYRPEPFIKPGPNLQFLMWLLLLGLPALLLFMIYSKADEQAPPRQMPAVHQQAH